MIIERIRTKLLQKGFQEIKVNIPGIYLLYYAAGQEINLAAFFDCPNGMEFNTEQYENIQRQLYRNYSGRGFTSVHIQTVICTQYVEAVRKFQPRDRNEWIIDMKNNRLIIYENNNPNSSTIKLVNMVDDLTAFNGDMKDLYEVRLINFHFGVSEDT